MSCSRWPLADAVTGRLLTEAAGGADLRGAIPARDGQQPREPDHEKLLATLGIDLAEIRQRVEDASAPTHSPTPPRPRGRRERGTALGVGCRVVPDAAPGVQQSAGRSADRDDRSSQEAPRPRYPLLRPGLATPCHLLLALVTGDEPANETLPTSASTSTPSPKQRVDRYAPTAPRRTAPVSRSSLAMVSAPECLPRSGRGDAARDIGQRRVVQRFLYAAGEQPQQEPVPIGVEQVGQPVREFTRLACKRCGQLSRCCSAS